MAATIKDIAQQLNISISTVSYALNGGPRRVPSDVRDRVLALAAELDYRPNFVARSMATGRAETIAVVPLGGTHPMFCSPYVLTVINGLVEAAEHLEQDILLRTHPERTDAEGLTRALLNGKADGVVLISPPLGSKAPGEFAKRGFPCVVIGGEAPEGAVDINTDNAAATELAMLQLTELGHRRIGHLAGRMDQRDAVERLSSYRHFLRSHELPERDEWIVAGEFHYEVARRAGLALLSLGDRPTAVLAANDESGIGLVDAAREMGLRVPEDLSVVAYDLLPSLFLQMRQVSATRQPLREMTSLAVRILVQWAREGKTPEVRRHVLTTEFVEMGTVGAPSEQGPADSNEGETR